jgi:serine phosphatase RsbU (regulator of sigma subunit)
MPIAFLHLERYIQPVTLYFRLESPNIKQLPMQILTEKAYGRASRRQSLWLGIYYGIMLAMIIYNLVWLLSLREWYRLYYLFYLCSFVIAFLGINGLLGEFFHLDDHLNLILIYVLICLVFFWAHLFAKSFLITKKHAPFFDKLLSICMGIALVLAILIPFMSLPSMMLAVFIQNIVVPPIFLLAAVTALRKGFRPARFFLIAFATLALSTIYEALVFFRLLPLFTLYATQATSAIEVILLQLALADRFRTLSQEQDRIEQSLYLAREVQQNLLPHNAPQTDWLDIAGQSIYCDETGGDYYDFIINDTGGNASIGIALGDVSGHGISSALLMATVRSSLRQRSTRPGIAAEIISDVNRQLAEDVGDSGQFMTMFYMLLDPVKQQLQWVRAGHDPAIFYDPDTDAFGELDGPGVALGVLDGFNYKEFTKRSLHSGQIIVLSTDGIWEARNQKSEMFGKERLLNIIRKNSQLSARDILDAMLEALKNFQKGFEIEDDITLVVIKIK